MGSISTYLKYVLLVREKLKSVLSYLWHVYSAPSVVGQDVLTLISLCSAIAMATAGLLYHWLSEILRYDRQVSVWIACAYSVVVSVSLILFHPLRCVITMAMLTLFTKQGRKLVISASFVILIFNVVPNITINIGVAVHILKCTSEGFARSLLNSSDILNRAKGDLVTLTSSLSKVKHVADNWIQLDHFMHIDVSEVNSKFNKISWQIERDFSYAKGLVKDYKLLFNRILAALFIFLLILQSARYLKIYLTSLPFENKCPSKESIEHHPESSVGEKYLSKKQRIIRECQSGLMSIVMVTLYYIAVTFIIVLDHIVFQIVNTSVPWFLNIPSTPASITVTFKASWMASALCIVPSLCTEQVLTDRKFDYSWVFGTEPSLCDARPSAPDVGVRVLLASLWLLSYFFVLLEVLARRARRRVAASFFRKQEERRALFLVKKVQAERDKNQLDIFSVSVACV